MMGDMGTFGGWGWGMGFGWILMILFWGLIILGIVALIKWLFSRPSGGGNPGGNTALEILQERYARGEMDRDEYGQRRKDLSR